MKMASVREFRNGIGDILDASGPVMITRHGKLAGFFLPWKKGVELPLEIMRAAFKEHTKDLEKAFAGMDINEEEMIADFEKWRKNRRRGRR
jgi:hypothetical protein